MQLLSCQCGRPPQPAHLTKIGRHSVTCLVPSFSGYQVYNSGDVKPPFQILSAVRWVPPPTDSKRQYDFPNITLGLSLSLNPKEGFPDSSVVRNLSAKAGDVGSIPGWGRSPGKGNGNPLQYSSLGNPMDREAWWLQSTGLQRVAHELATRQLTPKTLLLLPLPATSTFLSPVPSLFPDPLSLFSLLQWKRRAHHGPEGWAAHRYHCLSVAGGVAVSGCPGAEEAAWGETLRKGLSSPRSCSPGGSLAGWAGPGWWHRGFHCSGKPCWPPAPLQRWVLKMGERSQAQWRHWLLHPRAAPSHPRRHALTFTVECAGATSVAIATAVASVQVAAT